MTTIKRWYCTKFHSRLMFAGGATYRCATCGHVFACPWSVKVKD